MPTEIFAALPYVVTLIVMVAATVWAGRDAQPSALGIPFRRGGKRVEIDDEVAQVQVTQEEER